MLPIAGFDGLLYPCVFRVLRHFTTSEFKISVICSEFSYSTDIDRFAGTEINRFVSTEISLFAGTEINRFAGTEISRFVSAEISLFAGAGISRFAGAGINLSASTEISLFAGTDFDLLAGRKKRDTGFIAFDFVKVLDPHANGNPSPVAFETFLIT